MDDMSEELKQEIYEVLNFTVNSGYFAKEEVEEIAIQQIEELFFDYERSLLAVADVRQMIMEVKTSYQSTSSACYERLRQVFDQLNRERIIAVDFAGYDMSEGHESVGDVFQFMKANEIPRFGYCFFHQQDIERSMDPTIGELFLAFNSMNGDEEIALAVGKRVVSLLAQQNFTVSWDETVHQRICIEEFTWDKVFNNEANGVEQAIQVMRETYVV
ncbi:hypothetical protein I6N95_07615 [Vagococcus sp. BWB3-3]|uniref:DUF6891 domain-containing protein n=1 Tax=Vagococcus allomyrinae TaxID=2794353 RepID=A0A940P9D8_9ENTE|nr:hypothetical protein [Vagococcus allomyrinae]MBP1040869.1 hypothetical protein [Vagococcus allomyrinae]